MRRHGPDPAPGSRRRHLRPVRTAVLLALLAVTATACSSKDLPTFAMPARDTTNQTERILSLWQGAWIAAWICPAVAAAPDWIWMYRCSSKFSIGAWPPGWMVMWFRSSKAIVRQRTRVSPVKAGLDCGWVARDVV